MADIKGDPTKMPDTCRVNVSNTCPNLQSRETWSSETRWCDVCGERFTLYDDEMR
jgi:hypothetical protein